MYPQAGELLDFFYATLESQMERNRIAQKEADERVPTEVQGGGARSEGRGVQGSLRDVPGGPSGSRREMVEDSPGAAQRRSQAAAGGRAVTHALINALAYPNSPEHLRHRRIRVEDRVCTHCIYNCHIYSTCWVK